MKIAVIGSGISSLTAAHLLAARHEVHVFEKDERLGGHTATQDIQLVGQQFAIDTGFIVYNNWTYPNFIRLLSKLGVASRPTEMSFSVCDERAGLEYSGSNLNTLFAQRRNLLRPGFWRLLRDILRFNKESVADLQAGRLDPAMTLSDYLRKQGYGEAFICQYLVPMGAAIWSSGDQVILDFQALFFIRFFHNHGLLSVNNRPQWYTLVGGSRAYLEPISRRFAANIHLNAHIAAIHREPDAVRLCFVDGSEQHFEQLVMGCHSDQALALLADPSPAEQAVLGAIPYAANEVVLHTDTRLLPQRHLAWASWNSRLTEAQHSRPVLTYNMNILQGLQAPETFCVTLNHSHAIDPGQILGRYEYHHPVFTPEGHRAQARWTEINGVNRSWFCGAYWANGFHEDGVVSGIRVAQALGADW